MTRLAHRATSGLIVTSVAVALVGCGSSPSNDTSATTMLATAPPAPPSTVTSVTATPSPAWFEAVTGELIITRQRDLIDRGLISVLVRNDSDVSMLMSELQLVADGFSIGPAPQRTVSVRSGRHIAVQVPYGVADECDNDRAIESALEFSVTGDDDTAPQAHRLELDGTDILEAIRAEQCTTRRLEDAVRLRFTGTSIVDGAVETDLVIEPVGTTVTTAGLSVEAVSGTVLVAARARDDWSGVELGDEAVTVPLRFVVNRCDPHALAEVTQPYGLDLAVAVDDAESAPVAVDVSALVADLGAIVEQCVAAAG